MKARGVEGRGRFQWLRVSSGPSAALTTLSLPPLLGGGFWLGFGHAPALAGCQAWKVFPGAQHIPAFSGG